MSAPRARRAVPKHACTTWACTRKAALTRREWAAHTPGPSRACAALRAAGDNGAMPRPTARGRALAELKAARHRHAGPTCRGRAGQGRRTPRRVGCWGHAMAAPRPHQGRATTAGRVGTGREGGRAGGAKAGPTARHGRRGRAATIGARRGVGEDGWARARALRHAGRARRGRGGASAPWWRGEGRAGERVGGEAGERVGRGRDAAPREGAAPRPGHGGGGNGRGGRHGRAEAEPRRGQSERAAPASHRGRAARARGRAPRAGRAQTGEGRGKAGKRGRRGGGGGLPRGER
jgi:hypothetical protein